MQPKSAAVDVCENSTEREGERETQRERERERNRKRQRKAEGWRRNMKIDFKTCGAEHILRIYRGVKKRLLAKGPSAGTLGLAGKVTRTWDHSAESHISEPVPQRCKDAELCRGVLWMLAPGDGNAGDLGTTSRTTERPMGRNVLYYPIECTPLR
eukprot:scaffold8268_cov286-Pinguiococcus_pyrenoidosus.AAC.1